MSGLSYYVSFRYTPEDRTVRKGFGPVFLSAIGSTPKASSLREKQSPKPVQSSPDFGDTVPWATYLKCHFKRCISPLKAR